MTYHLYKSTIKNKKYMVKFINPISNRLKTIHFGAEENLYNLIEKNY